MKQRSNHRYEVHTYTLCQGWMNCWSVIECNGNEYPESFETVKQAQDAINEFLADISCEIDCGQRQMGEGYDRTELCIFDTMLKVYVS